MEFKLKRSDFIIGLGLSLMGWSGLRRDESPTGYTERKIEQITGKRIELLPEGIHTENTNNALAFGGAAYAAGSLVMSRRRALLLSLAVATTSNL